MAACSAACGWNTPRQLRSTFSLPRAAAASRRNEDVVNICNRLAAQGCDAIAAELGKQAVAKGSTDDVTVLVLKLK